MTEAKTSRRTKVQVKFRLPVATHQALTTIAHVKGRSLTDTINRALRMYVDEAKSRKPAA